MTPVLPRRRPQTYPRMAVPGLTGLLLLTRCAVAGADAAASFSAFTFEPGFTHNA
jgi:hypothetical protein